MKTGFYTTTGDDQLSWWVERKLQSTSQSQTCTKKFMVTVGGLLPVWSTTAFWIRTKPLHLRSTLSKTAVPTDGIGQENEPSSFPQQFWLHVNTANTSEVEWTGLQSFASSAIFTWSLADWLPLLQTSGQLCRESASTTSIRQKMLSKCWLGPEHRFFYSGEINQLISRWQKWVGCNSSCFD